MNLNVRVTVTSGTGAAQQTILDVSDQVVCNAILGCPYASLAAGDYLANGAYTVRAASGADLIWNPSIAGTYQVKVTLEGFGDQDTDLTNNELSYSVSVVDWNDISVDICWVDGDECYADAAAALKVLKAYDDAEHDAIGDDLSDDDLVSEQIIDEDNNDGEN